MTAMRITEDERRQLEAAAQNIAAKLRAFHEGLPPDEQRALDLALRQLSAPADEGPEDTTGYYPIAGPGTLAVLAHLLLTGTAPYRPPPLPSTT